MPSRRRRRIPIRCSSTLSGRHLLSSDFGSDRLSVFGVEGGRLQRRMQQATGEGSGPGACALHPAGSVFYAWHELAEHACLLPLRWGVWSHRRYAAAAVISYGLFACSCAASLRPHALYQPGKPERVEGVARGREGRQAHARQELWRWERPRRPRSRPRPTERVFSFWMVQGDRSTR